eukprot:Selendium_serpulae@DN5023_c0_g2_i2.p1
MAESDDASSGGAVKREPTDKKQNEDSDSDDAPVGRPARSRAARPTAQPPRPPRDAAASSTDSETGSAASDSDAPLGPPTKRARPASKKPKPKAKPSRSPSSAKAKARPPSSRAASGSRSRASSSKPSQCCDASDDEAKRHKDKLTYGFKEAQRHKQPPKGDGTRAFYESLLEENPNSLMALKWCLEHGVLSG